MRTICWVAIMLLSCGANASIDAYEFDNAEQEIEFRELMQELRCPKCQNQNIADSNAGLAKDIKDRSFDLLKQGKSKYQISNYMVERYGDFITYRPPVRGSTWFLWFGPGILVLLVIVFLLFRKISTVKTDQVRRVLSDNDHARVNQLLKQYGPTDDENK